jgi:hypothetical protein
MKVVINVCYGGFSLSPKAVAYIANKNGLSCHFYVEILEDEDGNYISSDNRGYKKVTQEYAMGASVWNASTIATIEEYQEFMDFNWKDSSKEERVAHNLRYKELHHEARSITRHDESLVEAVEVLGSKEASGDCAELKVIDIPIAVYIINEYDGQESVSEPHQTWG